MLDGTQAMNTGSDGRLTILLLGSDTRGGGFSRTDTIMVASIKGKSISVVSIPRDTAHIPNPDGGTFSPRINAILKQLKAGRTNEEALNKFEQVIENLLQVEIDYHAVVTFVGFEALVNSVEPISVRIAHPVRDTKFWDDPNKPSGVYFPQADDYQLFALQPNSDPPLCNGLWKTHSEPIPNQYWCHRALPFVRSRKGASNSDFVRARRQQDFVMAAIRRVIQRGTGANLNALVDRANGAASYGALTTNIPITNANAIDLYNMLNGGNVVFQEVFNPPNYATHIPGGTAYELKLPEVRQVMKQWFGSTGAPPPTPTPTASPTSTPTATATGSPTATPTASPTATPTIPPTLPPGTTPTPTLPPGPTPTIPPTLPPGNTPTPSLPPGVSPAPLPSEAPPTTTPTLAPGETPGPTLAPGATPTPTAIAAVPSSQTAVPGASLAAGSSPVAAIVPTSSPNGGGALQGQEPQTGGISAPLLVALVLVLLIGGAALVLGWRRYRASP